MLMPLLGLSAAIVIGLRYRREGFTLAHWRNDIVAIVLIAAVVRILLKVIAL